MFDETARRLRQRWQPFDPARGGQTQPGPEARQRGLQAILSSGPPDPPTRRPALPRQRVMLITAAAAALVVTAVGVVAVLPPSPPASAATPPALTITAPERPVMAAVRLQRLADKAEHTAGTSPPGPVEHLVIDQWAVHMQISGERVNSAVIPSRRQIWRTRQNAGRVITGYLPPTFRSDAARRAWHDAGSPGADASPNRQDFADDSYPALWSQRPPTGTAALRRWLTANHRGDDAVITAVADLLAERVLTAPERAAVLRVLAQTPGLMYAGTTRDRAGRPGDAYTVTTTDAGLPMTVTFIIDAHTGVILAHEHTLTENNGTYDVQTPAVILYDTYLDADFQPTMP